MYIGLYVKYALFLSDFNETRIISKDCRKIITYKISRNASSGSRVVPCGRTDRHDETQNTAEWHT